MKRKHALISVAPLPEDVIKYICSNLTLKQLLWPISLVSKTWLYCAKTQGLWAHIKIKRLKPRKLNNLVKRYGQNLITLHVANMPITKYIMKTLMNCKKLRKLQLHKTWASSVTDDSFCNYIAKMNLAVLFLPRKAKLSEFALKKLASSTIQELSIPHNLFGTIEGYAALGTSKYITCLNLCGCRQINNRAIREISKLPLITLDISFTSINRYGIEHIAESNAANTLEKLLFNGLYIPQRTLIKLSRIKLQTLSLSHIGYDEDELCTLRRFTEVQQLYLSAFEITVAISDYILEMKELKGIYAFCNEISMQTAIDLFLQYKLLMYKPLGLTHQEKNTLRESGVIIM